MSGDTQVIAMISGVLIPILVALLTKLRASSKLKAMANAILCAVSGALSTVIPGAFSWKPFAVAALSTWAVSVATYYGLWKPTGVTQATASATAGVGIGSLPS
jgi:hypothetical protein